VADARRVDHRDRQAGRAQRCRHDRFIAARRLDADTDQLNTLRAANVTDSFG